MSPEYETLLALKSYLRDIEAKQLQTMVDNKEPLNDINIFINNALTDRQINTAKLLYSDQADEYKEYEHKLNEDERRWVKKFYAETEGNALYNIPEDYRLLKTKEMIKESNRIRNRKKTDMFEIGLKTSKLDTLETYENRLSSEEGQLDWEQVYSCFGHEYTLNFLIDECQKQLLLKTLDTRLTLVRFYIKMNRLRLAHNREGRNK